MGLLTRLGEPILERLRALTTQSRMVAVSLGLLIVIGLWLLAGRTASHEFVALLDGREFTEPQMARIIAAFRKHRLEGARISGRNVEIPAAQKDFYLMAVDAENAWPAKFDAPVERALAGANPLMSWQQNRENLQRSEKQMLARIVAEMSGIENAAVQYDEIRHPGFPPRVESRAMVAVKAVGLRHLEPEEIEAIRDTVVAFKSGLQRENVTITDLNACRAYPGCRASDASHLSARTLAAAQRAFEEEWQAKIEERLHMYPDLTIAVNAHFTQAAGTAEIGKRTGTDPASVMQLAQVTASIDVPKSYFVNVWRQRHGHSGRDVLRAEQIQEIEAEVFSTIARAVSAMLPSPAPGWQTSDQVLVTSHDDLLPEPGPASRVPQSLLGIGSAVIALIVAAGGVLGVLLVFRRRAARRKSNPDRDAAAPPSGAPDRPLLTVFSAPSPPSPAELQRQLTKLVRQDPAAVAEALKSWLNRPNTQQTVDSPMTLQDEFLRKAAVLIGTLDDQATESLLELLGRERTVRLRQMLTELAPVTLDERSQIIQEFLQTTEPQAECIQDAEGVELDDSLAARIASAEDISPDDGLSDAPPPRPIAPEASPFSFLLPEDPRVLGDLLAAEHAQTISVVLSYLPSVKTAELLQQLPGPLRRDVLECLGRLQGTEAPDAAQLAAQLRAALRRRPRESVRTKTAVATAAPREAPAVFEFDDLNALTDHALAMVFQRTEPRVALIALTGASPSLFQRIQRQLPWRESRELRHQIERLGPIRLSDVEHAQRKLAETAAALIRDRSISPPKNRRFATAA
jgi:flagellar motor switch protein FliG